MGGAPRFMEAPSWAMTRTPDHSLSRLSPSEEQVHDRNHKTPLDNARYNEYISDVPSKLQKELKQIKPFACMEEEVHLNIIRTAEWLSAAFSETLKSADLTPTQYNALRILRGAEEGLS